MCNFLRRSPSRGADVGSLGRPGASGSALARLLIASRPRAAALPPIDSTARVGLAGLRDDKDAHRRRCARARRLCEPSPACAANPTRDTRRNCPGRVDAVHSRCSKRLPGTVHIHRRCAPAAPLQASVFGDASQAKRMARSAAIAAHVRVCDKVCQSVGFDDWRPIDAVFRKYNAASRRYILKINGGSHPKKIRHRNQHFSRWVRSVTRHHFK